MPAKKKHRIEKKWIRRDSVVVDGVSSFTFRLPFHKVDHLYKGAAIPIVSGNSTSSFNFVQLLLLYLAKRDALLPSSPFLFVRANGLPALREFFTRRLAAIAPGVTGHGLRSGGATFLASRGARPDLIQRMGRWSSEDWTIYLRDNPAVAAAVQRVELARL